MSNATLRPVSPWAIRYLNRRFVSSALPNPANIRIVHSRPRYMVGWMPRVNGKPPGVPSRSSTPAVSHSRSEEHTSELQSPCNLVCRLLLGKKKKKHQEIIE